MKCPKSVAPKLFLQWGPGWLRFPTHIHTQITVFRLFPPLQGSVTAGILKCYVTSIQIWGAGGFWCGELISGGSLLFFLGCLTSIGTNSGTSLPSRIRLWEGLGACWLQSLSIEILLRAQPPFTHQHSFNPYLVLQLLSYIALLSTPFMSCFASSLHLLDSSWRNLLKVSSNADILQAAVQDIFWTPLWFIWGKQVAPKVWCWTGGILISQKITSWDVGQIQMISPLDIKNVRKCKIFFSIVVSEVFGKEQ